MSFSSARNKLLGIAFILLLIVAVGLLIAKFQQRFDTTPTVTLQVPQAGNELNSDADVKIRGYIIGKLKSQKVQGDHITLKLAIPRHDLDVIPTGVKAQVLPETLFGQKYVNLVIPAAAAGATLKPGDVIPLDQSAEGIEVTKALSDLTFLLRDLQPAKVNAFLSNLSGALANNGQALGQTLVQLDNVAKGVAPDIGTVQTDITGLGDLAQSLDTNAADLLNLAKNTAITGKTITDKQDDLAHFLAGTAGVTTTFTNVLNADGNDLITIAANSKPVLQTLDNMRNLVPSGVTNLNSALHALVDPKVGALQQGPFLNVRLYPQTSQGKYTTADCVKYPGLSSTDCPSGGLGTGLATPSKASESKTLTIDPNEDKGQLQQLLAPLLGVSPSKVPDIADLLFESLLSGQTVSLP